MKLRLNKTTILLFLMLLSFPLGIMAQETAAAGGYSLTDGLKTFWETTSFGNFDWRSMIMLAAGIVLIYLGVVKHWEPLLLIPIGFGILVGNIPFKVGDGIGIYEEGSVYNILYQGVITGWYPPLIFLGIGAMTDFSSLISNPKLMLLGAAAQLGIFVTFIGAYALGFTPQEAGAVAIIGGADGPTTIFLTSKLAPHLIGATAIAAYSYMALVPLIQPPIMRLLTTKKERLIRMKPPRQVSKTEKIIFPIVGLILTCFIAPSALPLLGMLFLGNLLKESGVTDRLADTARNALMNTMVILIGLTVGASTQAVRWDGRPRHGRTHQPGLPEPGLAEDILPRRVRFAFATAGGVLFAKVMNLFLKDGNKINPLIGSAGVSAVPAAARVSQDQGLKADRTNHLLMHAMAPNVAGVIGSAVAAGILLSMLS